MPRNVHCSITVCWKTQAVDIPYHTNMPLTISHLLWKKEHCSKRPAQFKASLALIKKLHYNRDWPSFEKAWMLQKKLAQQLDYLCSCFFFFLLAVFTYLYKIFPNCLTKVFLLEFHLSENNLCLYIFLVSVFIQKYC